MEHLEKFHSIRLPTWKRPANIMRQWNCTGLHFVHTPTASVWLFIYSRLIYTVVMTFAKVRDQSRLFKRHRDLRMKRSVVNKYCIVSIHLYSASCSVHQSEALPVRETQREGSRSSDQTTKSTKRVVIRRVVIRRVVIRRSTRGKSL